MLHRSSYNSSRRACLVCSRRKVKCDRLIPCSNCIKRGEEEECISTFTSQSLKGVSRTDKNYLQSLLKIWQSYEYWIMDIGLFKTKSLSPADEKLNLEASLRASDFWFQYLSEEQSFTLLNFAAENLGALYFGYFSDVNKLFVQLELYWRRWESMEGKLPEEYQFTADDYYWNALLWSVFTMSVYYIPLELLSEIFPVEPICDLFQIEKKREWTDALQLTLYQEFSKCTIDQLNRANYLRYPDIRLIQTYLILSTTMFPTIDYTTSDGLLLQCMNVAKILNIDFRHQFVTEDPVREITKGIISRIWYSLCICDYIQSNPDKRIVFHTEIASLVQHTPSSQDEQEYDIYRPEDSFESLCWRLLSLKKDLDRYLNLDKKPRPRTLATVKRELDSLEKKLGSRVPEERSVSSRFEKFLTSFLINVLNWKINKLNLIFFGTSHAFQKTVHYTRVIAQLLVNNVTRGTSLFNKHPWVMYEMSRIIPFYSFYRIFDSSQTVQDLNKSLDELTMLLPMILGDKVNKLIYLNRRLKSMGELWEKVRIVGSDDSSNHPVFKILQDDINFVLKYHNRISLLEKDFQAIREGSDYYSSAEENVVDEYEENEEFKVLVSKFESENDMKELIEG